MLKSPVPKKAQSPDSLVMRHTKLSFAEGSRLYRELRADVEKAGIFQPTYGYYFGLAVILTIGFVASAVAVVLSTTFIATVLAALALAFFLVQFGGILHDAGHRAIFPNSKKLLKYNLISPRLCRVGTITGRCGNPWFLRQLWDESGQNIPQCV